MKKYINMLFCKHNFKIFYEIIGNTFYLDKVQYYYDYRIEKCEKCGKIRNLE